MLPFQNVPRHLKSIYDEEGADKDGADSGPVLAWFMPVNFTSLVAMEYCNCDRSSERLHLY